MFRGYRERLAEILSVRFGFDPDAWRRAHDEAFVDYGRRVNETDWDARGWAEIVDELDSRQLVEMFEKVGADSRPEEPLALSRGLGREGVGRRGPGGHKVLAPRGGGDTNEAARGGAAPLGLFAGVFTGPPQTPSKSRP